MINKRKHIFSFMKYIKLFYSAADPFLDSSRSSQVQCPRQTLPKVQCKLKEQKYKMVRESSHLYNICKFLVPSIPTPASQDPQGFSIPLADANCMNWLTACSLLFVLYGSSSVPALLFLAATTRLYHNPLAKLN